MHLAWWLPLVLLPVSCWAAGGLHSHTALFACGDPAIARIINNQAGSGRVEFARRLRDGQCFLVAPDQLWEKIHARDGLILARRIPPVAGEPPLFFRPYDLTASPPDDHYPPAASDSAVPDLAAPGAGRAAGFRLGTILLVALLALPARKLPGAWRRLGFRRGRARALRLAIAEIEAQRRKLQIRRMQLVIPDHYGTSDLSRWDAEKQRFTKSRILRLLAAEGLAGQWPHIAKRVDRQIERAAMAPAAGRQGFDPRMDPVAYEQLCASLLRKAGWDAQVTAASGDQGTDVLAHRGKQSLVLQCKLYGKPVGNSAVQQVAAARAHHRADFAAVVSNADFTPLARQLAATNGVYLLHHDELRDFSKLKAR